MNISRIFTFLFLAFALLVSPAQAAGGAQNYLEVKQKELTELIKKPKSGPNDEKLKATFDALLDYSAFARDSLDDEWQKLSEKERADFQALLKTLIQRSYTKNLRNTLDYNIIFKGASSAKKGELVQTVAKHKTDPRKESISIDYLVHQADGSFRVYDIITEGESLVKNYKSQFRRVIKKEGFSGLLERMRTKAAEEG